jgi:hypothetical protein
MKKNMGTIDRAVRLLVALTVALLYWQGIVTGIPALLLGLVAAIFLITGLVGSCPLYQLFGWSTCPAR